MALAPLQHGGIVSCMSTYAQGPCEGMNWREVISCYPTEWVIFGTTSIAKGIVQLETWDMDDVGGPSIGGKMS